MPRLSAGLLMYRAAGPTREVFLVHPGGPLWSKKDHHAWFIPKGEVEPGEDELSAACREFTEETGFTPSAPFLALGRLTTRPGKIVVAWAFEGTADPSMLVSNTFTMEWPPRSGRHQSFPEVDRGRFYTVAEARVIIYEGERDFLDRLAAAT
jgi:predicted NUDIX family NTP pyrophosphohydrolase